VKVTTTIILTSYIPCELRGVSLLAAVQRWIYWFVAIDA